VRVFGGRAGAGSVRAGGGSMKHAVKAGSYESLIEAQYKFDLMESSWRRCGSSRRIGSG